METSNAPVVSICMSTFEHEAFIAQAIEGVMMQQTDFAIQLVIGEDLSKDNTRKICEALALKYGEKVNLLPSDKKYGQNHNLSRIVEACTGKYVALCEGDDYWTDPLKLQKQVDFLESHPDHVMCFHKVNSVDQNNSLIEENKSSDKIKLYSGPDMFHIFIPTLAIVFRNCLRNFPEEFYKVKSTDAFMFGMLSGFGKGADLGFVGANYRKHIGGLYNRLDTIGRYSQSIHTRKQMSVSSFFSREQKAEIKKELNKRTVMYSKYFLKKKELGNFFRFIFFRFTAW